MKRAELFAQRLSRIFFSIETFTESFHLSGGFIDFLMQRKGGGVDFVYETLK